MPDVSIVIPAFNEANRLPASILAIQSYLARCSFSTEVIIVIEKSTDQTYEHALRAIGNDRRFRCIKNPGHRGKGFAVRTGMLLAQGEIVFYMDADLSTPLSQIDLFLNHFRSQPQTDGLVGSRVERASRILQKQSLPRQFMARVFRLLVGFSGVRGIIDTQCGFKAFRRSCVPSLFGLQTLDGFAFDVEILLLAQLQAFKIHPVPIEWRNSPDSRVNVLIDPLRMLFDLFQIRFIARKSLETALMPRTDLKKAS